MRDCFVSAELLKQVLAMEKAFCGGEMAQTNENLP